MKTRPWPLVVLAILQIWSPISSILVDAAVYQTSALQVMYWLFRRPPMEIFEFLVLMPVAGVAIYQMKRWSYAIFFIAMAWSIWAKMRHWDYATSTVSFWFVIASYFCEAALVVYFLLPSVRRTYLDPTVRWWEQMPRYQVDSLATLRLGADAPQCHVMNISQGGAFIRCVHDLVAGSELMFDFQVLSRVFSVPGQVLRTMEMPETGAGSALGKAYALRFSHDEKTAEEFGALTDGLAAMGFPDRQEHKSFLRGLAEWALTTVKTGRGLLPEPKSRN